MNVIRFIKDVIIKSAKTSTGLFSLLILILSLVFVKNEHLQFLSSIGLCSFTPYFIIFVFYLLTSSYKYFTLSDTNLKVYNVYLANYPEIGPELILIGQKKNWISEGQLVTAIEHSKHGNVEICLLRKLGETDEGYPQFRVFDNNFAPFQMRLNRACEHGQLFARPEINKRWIGA